MRTENKCIDMHCKKCRKSFRVSYELTGMDEAPVLPNITLKCGTCKRTATFKKYTEVKLIEISKDNKALV